MAVSKREKRQKIHYRIRNKIAGTQQKPRLSVFRSNKAIYAQLIDDLAGTTLASASTLDSSIDKSINKTDQAKAVGQLLAERAKSADISTVVFDRGGYLYHGRVKALAEGAREGGLNF
ncbi:MAG: 50S ribosomal protein L18 [Bacteroidota bacterium]